jgi:hypothetical protein
VAKVAHTMVICTMQKRKKEKEKKQAIFTVLGHLVEPKPFWSALTFKG